MSDDDVEALRFMLREGKRRDPDAMLARLDALEAKVEKRTAELAKGLAEISGILIELKTAGIAAHARLAAVEASQAKMLARMERLERTFVAHCELHHNDEAWGLTEQQRNAWREIFVGGMCALCRDLAEIDRGRASQ